jgi:hypothetical protein
MLKVKECQDLRLGHCGRIGKPFMAGRVPPRREAIAAAATNGRSVPTAAVSRCSNLFGPQELFDADMRNSGAIRMEGTKIRKFVSRETVGSAPDHSFTKMTAFVEPVGSPSDDECDADITHRTERPR